MRCTSDLVLQILLVHASVSFADTETNGRKHHHHHHGHHRRHHDHGHHLASANANEEAATHGKSVAVVSALSKNHAASNASANGTRAVITEAQMISKMQAMEKELSAKEAIGQKGPRTVSGRLNVRGPLPVDFAPRFAAAVSEATGCNAAEVAVVRQQVAQSGNGIVVLDFEAPVSVVHSVEDQAADPESKLAFGAMRPYLVADDAPEGGDASPVSAMAVSTAASSMPGSESAGSAIDVDTDMPYGELEPFGREDTAQELTEQSVSESNEMVDQLERAEVAEEKRSVFRALTRLRGAAITSFDGIARSQTGNIDEYNKVHKWRNTHPLRHLADEESDVSKWAFPDDADF